MFDAYWEKTYGAATTDSFLDKFKESSEAGDEAGMIDMIASLPIVKSFQIKESYDPKNVKRARDLLKKSEFIPDADTKDRYLDEALRAVPFGGNDNLFLDVLRTRIRNNYDAGNYEKCRKNCQYMIFALQDSLYADSDVYAYKIEAILYHCKALKILGDHENLRIIARDAIGQVKMYIEQLTRNEGSVSNEKKIEMIAPFLNVLKDEKKSNGIVRSPVNYESNSRTKEVLPSSFARNPVLNSCSDAIDLRQNECRGRHLVATRNIKTGSVLIVDQPYAWSTEQDMLATHCLHCHECLETPDAIKVPCRNCRTVNYCSEECRSNSWRKYHRYECVILDSLYSIGRTRSSRVVLGYRATVTKAFEGVDSETNLNREFLKYYDNDSEQSMQTRFGFAKEYDCLDYGTVYSLATNCSRNDVKINLMQTISSIFIARCIKFAANRVEPLISLDSREETILARASLRHLLAVNSNAYEIVENQFVPETKIWEPRTIGGAIYTTVSLTNHSCYPNVVRHTYPNGNVVVRSIRFIEEGEEILDCYGPHFLRDTREDRVKYLWEKYKFQCVCRACASDWKSPLNGELYRCFKCAASFDQSTKSCSNCGAKVDAKKMAKRLKETKETRLVAFDKMLTGQYTSALPLLLNHSDVTSKILADPNLESIKTQQALIQCYNSANCVSK